MLKIKLKYFIIPIVDLLGILLQSIMEIKTLTVGEMAENSYLFYNPDSLECIIIDPGDEADFISQEILNLKLTPLCIILTHGHYDHCLGCLELTLNFNIPIFLNSKDIFLYQKASQSAEYWSKTPSLKQPPTLPLNSQSINNLFTIIPTPGHTPGSVCLYSAPFLFTGDTLFSDAVGRTDLSYSSPSDLQASLKTLSKLPPETIIFPGHGDSTSLQEALENQKKGGQE